MSKIKVIIIKYSETNIETNSIENIKKRNEKKRNILNRYSNFHLFFSRHNKTL